MTRDNILDMFTRATRENFPVDHCTNKNETNKNVYDSNKLFWVVNCDLRYENELAVNLATPYIWIDENNEKFYGWVIVSGNRPIDNIENPVNNLNWDEAVLAFTEYE